MDIHSVCQAASVLDNEMDSYFASKPAAAPAAEKPAAEKPAETAETAPVQA